jgi:hypothetical protein
MGIDLQVRRATQMAETPSGKFKRRSQNLSAPKICPKTLLKAETLMLFSEAGRTPVSFMIARPRRIGAKKVRLA